MVGCALVFVACGGSSNMNDDAGPMCAAAECTSGTSRCATGGIQRCNKNSAGCVVWLPRTACSAGETCLDGANTCTSTGAGGGGEGGGNVGTGGSGGGTTALGGGSAGTGGGDQTNCVAGLGYTNGCQPCCAPFRRSFLGICVDASCRVGQAPCQDNLDCCSGQCIVGSCSEPTGRSCQPGDRCDSHFYCQESNKRCLTSPTLGETCNPTYSPGIGQIGPCDDGLSCNTAIGDAGPSFGVCQCGAVPPIDGGTTDGGSHSDGGINTDGGRPDGGTTDAGTVDGGAVVDGGPGLDAGPGPDAGSPDASVSDSGTQPVTDGGGIIIPDAG